MCFTVLLEEPGHEQFHELFIVYKDELFVCRTTLCPVIIQPFLALSPGRSEEGDHRHVGHVGHCVQRSAAADVQAGDVEGPTTGRPLATGGKHTGASEGEGTDRRRQPGARVAD